MVAKPRLWNRAPFIRLLLPFMAGIAGQWYCQFSIRLLLGLSITSLIIFLAGQLLPVAKKFVFSVVLGIVMSILFGLAGALMVWAKEARHQQNWIGGFTRSSYITQLKIEEPLVEKTASYKAVASVQGVQSGGKMMRASGRVLLYFKKDSSASGIVYGSQILLSKPLQEIKNSGNPGSFDFKRYSLFEGVTHQVYITRDDLVLLSTNEKNEFKDFLFKSRASIISVLGRYISGDKEQGLAEALLIGYKDDLDKTLVQSYSNTGVVHVIAISGLHLGIIYWILLLLTGPLKDKKLAPLRLFLILSGLWGFSFLAGAQPSVLRSALCFLPLHGVLLSTAKAPFTIPWPCLLFFFFGTILTGCGTLVFNFRTVLF
jgi:competence protein ComEC